jgi:hypothetical protein
VFKTVFYLKYREGLVAVGRPRQTARTMGYSPPPAPWLQCLHGPDEAISSEEDKSCHEDTRDSRAGVLDALEHRQSALEDQTAGLTRRVQGPGMSEGLRLPPPCPRRNSLSATRDIAGDAEGLQPPPPRRNSLPVTDALSRGVMTGKGLPPSRRTSSLSQHARSRVTQDHSIQVYVKGMLDSEAFLNPCTRPRPFAPMALRGEERRGAFPHGSVQPFAGMPHAFVSLHTEGRSSATPGAEKTDLRGFGQTLTIRIDFVRCSLTYASDIML